MTEAHGLVTSGYRDLAAGRFDSARDLLLQAVADDPTGHALDGLAEAMWWLDEVEAALGVRARGHAAHRRAGDFDAAARGAAWIAREKFVLYADASLAGGWLARARDAARRGPVSAALGWVRLTEATLARDPAESVAALDEALSASREHADADLESVVLARRGVLLIGRGNPDEGVASLNEAMAAASGGEGLQLRTLAEVYCALVDATELIGGSDLLASWSAELMRPGLPLGPLAGVGALSPQAALSAFCGSCCGGVFLASGRLDDAEGALLLGIEELASSGLRSRCVHPAALLADLRIVQGRVTEASALLGPIEDLPEAARPLAEIDMLRGEPRTAVARLNAEVERLAGMPVACLPLLTILVEANLQAGDRAAARETAARIAAIASVTGSARHAAAAHLAAGRTTEDPLAAAQEFRTAAMRFSEAAAPLQASRARLLYAQAVASTDASLGVTEARAARAAFSRLGADSDVAAASAFLRTMGVRATPGPRAIGLLSTREREVLRLIAEGLSNPEIAQRLFISRKTAGHHVSSILGKLGLRSRTEAAAFAVAQGTRPSASDHAVNRG